MTFRLRSKMLGALSGGGLTGLLALCFRSPRCRAARLKAICADGVVGLSPGLTVVQANFRIGVRPAIGRSALLSETSFLAPVQIAAFSMKGRTGPNEKPSINCLTGEFRAFGMGSIHVPAI